MALALVVGGLRLRVLVRLLVGRVRRVMVPVSVGVGVGVGMVVVRESDGSGRRRHWAGYVPSGRGAMVFCSIEDCDRGRGGEVAGS